MEDEIWILFFCDAQNLKEDYIYAKHNCLVKPNIGESVSLNEEIYDVVNISIDYEGNTIHVFVVKR